MNQISVLEKIFRKRKRRGKKKARRGNKRCIFTEKTGKLGKVMVMYECKPANMMLSAMASVESSRWESLFAINPLMERRSSSYLSE